jgi:hypothetical protein
VQRYASDAARFKAATQASDGNLRRVGFAAAGARKFPDDGFVYHHSLAIVANQCMHMRVFAVAGRRTAPTPCRDDWSRAYSTCARLRAEVRSLSLRRRPRLNRAPGLLDGAHLCSPGHMPVDVSTEVAIHLAPEEPAQDGGTQIGQLHLSVLFGAIRTQTVAEVCFRMIAYIDLDLLPVAFVVPYVLTCRANWQKST